jgi:hypothetical protein
MKKVIVPLFVVIIIGVIAWRFFSAASHPGASPSNSDNSGATSSNGGEAKATGFTGAPNAVNPQASQPTVQNGRGSEAKPATNAPVLPYLLGSASAPPAMDPQTVLGNARIAIVNYGSRFGGNPVGTNPEITAALNGENPQQVKFLSAESGHRINGHGELVDAWGTPFFFHQISGTEMEIRSAGPDRKMYTADDLVTR